MRSLHVAVAQIQSKVGDPHGNLQRMHRQIQSSASVGVEVILFAETCLHAYCFYPENLAQAESIGGPLSIQVSNWAMHYNMTIMVGMFEHSDEGYHNSHLIAKPDGTLSAVRKHALTPYEVEAHLIPGPRERTPFDVNGVKCAILICADTGIDGIYDEMKAAGIEFVFIPTAGGGFRKDYLTIADLETADGLLKYIENRPRVYKSYAVIPRHDFHVAYAAANALGDDGAFMTHQGHCLIVDRHRVCRVQIPGTNVVDHFTDQMGHAVLTF